MPKNITISIPDSLHASLKETKGEFPISQTCAKALQDQINGIEQYALKAKIRFACFNLEDAELLAYNEGLRWAAEEAKIEQIIFIALFEDIDELERYAEYSQGLGQLIKDYPTDTIMDYFRDEIRDVVPDYMISKFYNDDRDYVQVAAAFLDGVRTIWKNVAPFADEEIEGSGRAYIFPELEE